MSNLHQKNRQKLINSSDLALLYISAAPETIRNSDVHHLYRQDSYFLYLTGITQSNHALLLDTKTKKSHLFIPDMTEYERIWNSRQLDKSEARRVYKVNNVHFMSELNSVLKKLSRAHTCFQILPHQNLSAKIPARLNKNTTELKKNLDQLRLIKENTEIKLLKKANLISHKGHIAAMKSCRKANFEYEVQANLEREFLHAGAHHKAYTSIVAAGPNAAILHYNTNQARLKKTDLMLIDAGCEWQGYASDVTRTFPLSGKFSSKQAAIYNVVLNTQNQCIKLVKPGQSLMNIHIAACKFILKGLADLGFFKTDDIETLYKKDVHRIFYPHGTGHLVGLDVHDVGAPPHPKKSKNKNLRAALELKARMVITIEPGIYFIEAYLDAAKIRKKYARYINWKTVANYRTVGGIRIEDDILVTNKGYENLTSVPKTIKAIEKIMRV